MFPAVMPSPPTTTLAAIRAAGLREDGWRRLLAHLGKRRADRRPLPLLAVLDGNGLDDTLWVLDRTAGAERLRRLFLADCAERVLPLFEAARPGDMRPREAIRVARDPDATEEQRRDAAGDAAYAACATWAAFWAANAASATAAAGTCDGRAGYAAGWAANAAPCFDTERAWQAERLRLYLTMGEDAALIPVEPRP